MNHLKFLICRDSWYVIKQHRHLVKISIPNYPNLEVLNFVVLLTKI